VTRGRKTRVRIDSSHHRSHQPGVISVAGPTAGVTAFALLMASTHDPQARLTRTFVTEPQSVAECMARNAGAMKGSLVVQTQPLYGMDVVGVTVKRRFAGDALLVATLTATTKGSTADFGPAHGVERSPDDLLEKLIAGCE
jgi:hypothetical protein